MSVETVKHDGPGRIGIFRLGERRFETPAVEISISPFNSFFSPVPPSQLDYDLNLAPAIPLGFYSPKDVIEKAVKRIAETDYTGYNTLYIPALKRIEMIEAFLDVMRENEFEAVYIGNSRQLERNYREFVLILRKLREEFPNVLIVMDVEPFLYPLAVYLGADAFDTRSLKLYDFQNMAFTPYSPFIWEEGSNSHDFSKYIIRLVSRAIEEGKLRYLVENFLNTPSNEGILRIADMENPDYLEEYTPTTVREILFVSGNSMRRPEVLRWQRRVVERFEPPKDTKLVLLLPCSAKKPYSTSRSHALYRKVIKEAVGISNFIHELILTSPLGVVPREWEKLAKYDIVVTGHWSREEIESAAIVLSKVLAKYPRDVSVVAHLEGPYRKIAEEAMNMAGREIIFTKVNGSTTTKKSLESLKDTLVEFGEELRADGKYREYRRLKELRSIFDYYLGRGAGLAAIPDGAKIRGSRMLVIKFEGKQTGTISDSSISLTPFGMQRVYRTTGSYWVKIDFELRGDVFAVGVNEADEEIRPGDLVGVIRDEEVVGVGRAVLSGREMIKAKRGIAVKIKNRKKV